MNKNWPLSGSLWLLLLFGFVNAVKLSIETLMGNSCPQMLNIPVCYVVAIAYSAMLLALMFKATLYRLILFWGGWAIATAIGLLASLAELFGDGPVCPIGAKGIVTGIPLCYISLVLLIVIAALFTFIKKR